VRRAPALSGRAFRRGAAAQRHRWDPDRPGWPGRGPPAGAASHVTPGLLALSPTCGLPVGGLQGPAQTPPQTRGPSPSRVGRRGRRRAVTLTAPRRSAAPVMHCRRPGPARRRPSTAGVAGRLRCGARASVALAPGPRRGRLEPPPGLPVPCACQCQWQVLTTSTASAAAISRCI
jgi:hypothetical protein